ncbi:hypothetical protein [Paracoccus sphaerophysae]|uniref:hypothetical protein n=1 Tax=Paracoccus sphaerophysae TaxID=690417 RepID=UPI0023566D49|nr:hypothetical protein [Paracoccus sphaerophysae]
MIDLSRRNVLVHIPKTGATVTERWLPRGFGLGWDQRGALGSFSNPAHSRLARANQHCTLAQIEDLVFGGPVPMISASSPWSGIPNGGFSANGPRASCRRRGCRRSAAGCRPGC